MEAIAEKKYNVETVVGLGAATTFINGMSFGDIQKIIGFITGGFAGLAYELIRNQPSGIPDLTKTSIKRIVNVWGTNDILAQAGIAGPKYLLGGIGTINIEIQGATHFDYMRRSPNDSNPPDARNIKVSSFVTELLRKANNELDLNNFLTSRCTKGADEIWRFTP